MTRNQLNLFWNCTPIYNSNIKGDYNSDVGIVDKYMKEVKYLLFDYENYFLKRKSRGKKKTN